MGQPSALLDSLVQSSARRYGRGSTIYFIILLPSGFPSIFDELPTESPLASVSVLPVRRVWVPFDFIVSQTERLPFSDSDDVQFLEQLSRAYRGEPSCAKQLLAVFLSLIHI